MRLSSYKTPINVRDNIYIHKIRMPLASMHLPLYIYQIGSIIKLQPSEKLKQIMF